MTYGLTRAQIGVTEEMIATYGERIWTLSHNVQVRRGDPVRELDWEEIERQRPQTGMSDGQIAERLGLTEAQVTFIRVALERRKFRRRPYVRLYDLGGGRRFRAERFTPHEDRPTFRPEAVALRRSLRFDPKQADHYFDEGLWNADTVSEWLAGWARETPDSIALIGPEEELSFAEVHDRALRLANGLLEIGIGKGDVVAIQLPNLPAFVITYYATTMIGAVLSTMHMPYRAAEMAPMLRHGSARAVVCGPATETYDAPSVFLELRDSVPTLENVIVAGPPPPGTLGLDDLITDSAPRPIDDPPVAADPAILCFTSGTSDAPKAVVHNHQTMLANNRIAAPLYGLGGDDIVLAAPPFTHAFGICVINFTLHAGATLFPLVAFTPPTLVEHFERGRPTVAFVAPAHLAATFESGLLEGCDLSSIRLATISGSTCPEDLARRFDEILPNGAVGQMWGMSECFMGLHTPFDADEHTRCATLGGPTPSFKVRVTAADGTPQPDGEEGELEIRGCSLFSGYFGNDEATEAAFTADGWFRTGDTAVVDPGGTIRLTGRVKDVINRGGVKINPTEVETLMLQHPSISQAAIAPIPDPVLGEKACLFVTLADGGSLNLEDACAHLNERGVAKLRWPERLEVVDEMPMTPTRKIQKGELVKRLLDA